jgi:hypothetical protein
MIGTARAWLWLVPFYVALATAAGFSDYHTRLNPDLGFTKYIPDVVSGTAEPPGRYRVLAPILFDRFERASGWSRVTDWLVFRWICLILALLAGHVYLRTWFGDGEAALGNALIMALLPLTFTNSWPNPDQFTELALFTFACACIARGWWWAFLAALAFNALNRETSLFLVLLFAVAGPMHRERLSRAAAAGVLWAAITVGLRWRLGFVPYDPWHLTANVASLVPMGPGFPGYKRIFGWFFLVLLVPCFLVAIRQWSRQPRAARVAAGVVAPLLVLTGTLFSSTIESRIFTPVLPLLAPSMLFALRGGDADPANHAPAATGL